MTRVTELFIRFVDYKRKRMKVIFITETISVMMGKGSVNHNSRVFNAKNTDPERTHLNIEYCNTDIKDVYHQLFDEALKRYNAKQTRADRRIEDYYEKIRTSKQEKPFYEVILQIGDRHTFYKDDVKDMLDEYMKTFQERNPYLKVFSAHLHMDESTPHLHIDFVPFTTGSKRGLDTRVSLKQALANQGFEGGCREETEWNQWVRSEKNELAKIMACHGYKWKQKGTHEQHLSVYDYKVKKRSEEAECLDAIVERKESELNVLNERLSALTECEVEYVRYSKEIDENEEYQLPEPPTIMTAKTYKTKFVEPIFNKLKELVKTLVIRYCQKRIECARLREDLESARRSNNNMHYRIEELEGQKEYLIRECKNLTLLRRIYGNRRVEDLLERASQESNQRSRSGHRDRGAR